MLKEKKKLGFSVILESFFYFFCWLSLFVFAQFFQLPFTLTFYIFSSFCLSFSLSPCSFLFLFFLLVSFCLSFQFFQLLHSFYISSFSLSFFSFSLFLFFYFNYSLYPVIFLLPFLCPSFLFFVLLFFLLLSFCFFFFSSFRFGNTNLIQSKHPSICDVP